MTEVDGAEVDGTGVDGTEVDGSGVHGTWAQARSALAAGRIDEAMAAFAAAGEAAQALAAADPTRIALAGEHGDAWFTHRDDPGRALEITTPVYEAAVDGIDDATGQEAAVDELAALRDRMIFWAFRLPD